MTEHYKGWTRRNAVSKACYESIAFLERCLYDYDGKGMIMPHYKALASATYDWSNGEIDRIIEENPIMFSGVLPKED